MRTWRATTSKRHTSAFSTGNTSSVVALIRKGKTMKMLATVNISKGFATWKAMADSLNPEMEKVGVSMVWGCFSS